MLFPNISSVNEFLVSAFLLLVLFEANIGKCGASKAGATGSDSKTENHRRGAARLYQKPEQPVKSAFAVAPPGWSKPRWRVMSACRCRRRHRGMHLALCGALGLLGRLGLGGRNTGLVWRHGGLIVRPSAL